MRMCGMGDACICVYTYRCVWNPAIWNGMCMEPGYSYCDRLLIRCSGYVPVTGYELTHFLFFLSVKSVCGDCVCVSIRGLSSIVLCAFKWETNISSRFKNAYYKRDISLRILYSPYIIL